MFSQSNEVPAQVDLKRADDSTVCLLHSLIGANSTLSSNNLSSGSFA